MYNENLTSKTPSWLRMVVLFCGIVTVLFCAFYITWAIYNGQLLLQIYRCTVLFIVILIIVFSYSKILFYSVTAKEKGLETDNIIGTNKFFQWEEIMEVRRPRFGFPVNFTYVVSKDEDSIFLIKNRKNYEALVQRIKEKASNLRVFNP